MNIHKKVAGAATTLGDLKQFIEHAEKEGFDDTTHLNGGKEVGLFVQVSDGDPLPEAVDSDFEGVCRECRKVVPASAKGDALVHYRGETVHRDAQCYGVGKRVTGLVKR